MLVVAGQLLLTVHRDRGDGEQVRVCLCQLGDVGRCRARGERAELLVQLGADATQPLDSLPALVGLCHQGDPMSRSQRHTRSVSEVPGVGARRRVGW